ncbi:Hypothetical Protein FCC1311_020892 [Hondaea fermentalgiana]|uniref:Uncharacterized protein n=1 Tax=Hondaea fermentalgiana TaxID=2315210 RepID=A0A2R5G4E1_9STRA|nr:Hypothetical Protein FCC1311_020892 [Hondaea fermentalgiana]|eukprot:GBG25870.1 Hypothetical Protein FCC1311_020892 [Hondaea fermentalgiana]
MRRRAGSSPTSPGWIRGATSGLKQALAHVVSKKDEKQQAEAESLGMYTPGFCEKRAKVAVHLGELRKCEKVLTSWVATIESMRRTAGLMCAENMGDDIQGLGGNLDEKVSSQRVLEVFQKAVRLVKEKIDLIYKLLRDVAELDKRLLHREKLKNKVEHSAHKLANKGKSFSTDDVPFTRDLDLAKENFESHSKVVSDILDFISVESRRGFAYRENVFVRQYCEATFKNMGSGNVDLSESMQRMEDYIEDFWTRQANFKNERQRERQLDKAYSTTFTGSRSRPQPFTDNAAATDVPNASSTGSNAHDARRFVPDGDDDPLPLRPKAGRKIPAWDTNKSSRKWMGGVTMNLGFPINEKDGWREYVSRDSGESFWVRLEDGHFQEKDPWKEGVVEDAASS